MTIPFWLFIAFIINTIIALCTILIFVLSAMKVHKQKKIAMQFLQKEGKK